MVYCRSSYEECQAFTYVGRACPDRVLVLVQCSWGVYWDGSRTEVFQYCSPGVLLVLFCVCAGLGDMVVQTSSASAGVVLDACRVCSDSFGRDVAIGEHSLSFEGGQAVAFDLAKGRQGRGRVVIIRIYDQKIIAGGEVFGGPDGVGGAQWLGLDGEVDGQASAF